MPNNVTGNDATGNNDATANSSTSADSGCGSWEKYYIKKTIIL